MVTPRSFEKVEGGFRYKGVTIYKTGRRLPWMIRPKNSVPISFRTRKSAAIFLDYAGIRLEDFQ